MALEIGGKLSSSAEDSDNEDDSPPAQRPVMVRKKSGELVKPALRPATHRRPSSMPGTPTYSKAVHFDSHLEHVRHFLQVDRPVAVSAGSSPVELQDSDPEFPFAPDEPSRSRAHVFEWEMVLSNFPAETAERRSLPARVERVFLSGDNKNLVGAVAVANLAFHKLVVVRFTLDYWKTTSEVVAEYNNDARRQMHDGYDRFHFNIKLADQANLENKTLFFCVRYNVGGQEFWDNNDSMNFQVSFRKNVRSGMQGLGTRPLGSMARARSSAPSGRPWSMPASFDDFADGFDSKFDFAAFAQPAAKIVGDVEPSSGNQSVRARKDGPLPDYPTRRTNGHAQAFGNRYDFGASLSAAMQAAHTDAKKGASGNKAGGSTVPTQTSPPRSKTSNVGLVRAGGNPTFSRPESYISEKPSQQSPTYLELIDKYCFVRSGTPRIAEST